MNRKYNLKLDLQFRCNNSTMKFNQFDNNTSDFFMRITNGGNLVDIEKAIVVLAIIKPSGKVASQFVEVENGLVYADLKPNMRDEIGTYTAKAMLILEDERVVTDSISYKVEEDKIFSLLNDTLETAEDFALLTDMLNRLSTIEISEEQRVINEAERILSEENRKIEEAKRVEAELIRQHEEADRAKYDATRESNENIRKQNESIRLANETNRVNEEAKRVEEEANRVEAEQLRKDNYNFMTEDEERRRVEANSHKKAEKLRAQAENTRVNEEAKRRTTEQARVSAENTRVSNENTRKDNEATRQTNETKRVEAETQRQNRYNSFIADAEINANNFENYTNSAKIKEEERKSNELDRKSQEDRRVSNEVERISNENTRKANEAVREKNETSRQNTFANKVNEVDKKIIELNTTKDNFVSNINTKVDTKISEIDNVKDNFVSSVNTKVDNKISELDNAKSDMTNTVLNKVNEVENRFNALTSKQQQDAEVIDARDGETSLKARLDRDIEKAKQVYVNVEGSHISTDSSVGYLKDIEILGNTIQSASNLADIRSVGDKIEGQELYEIPVLSVGKNLFDGNKFTPREAINQYSYIDGILTMRCDGQAYRRVDYILPNTLVHGKRYILTANVKALEYSSGYTPSQNFGYGYYNGGSADYYGSFDASSNTAKLEFVYNEQGENVIGFHNEVKEGLTKLQWSNIQIEEGTVATPYEPYQEDKLTILSPVQLEKVGDVRDRIIEKDGVCGVEKNVVDMLLNEANCTISMRNSSEVHPNYVLFDFSVADTKSYVKTGVLLCDKINYLPYSADRDACDKEGCWLGNAIFFTVKILKSRLESIDVDGMKKWLKTNNLNLKYQTTQPQFIPLPHDQQIKLRTFANKTNISFLTEIEGTIKAQVPKSLGATVNTHTEQINNLNKELDRVKKLEESTVSTVTTESDFTTVEATSNGYFEDVKLEGKTLVNLAPKYSIKWTHSGTWLSTFLVGTKNNSGSNHYYKIIQDLKPNTEYTVIVNIKTNTQSGNIDLNNYQNNNTCVFKDNMFVKPSDIGIKTFKVKTVESFDNIDPSNMVILRSQSWGIASGETLIEDIMILEGDHTQNPPSYFEGLKSVGDGTDEISVESVDGDGNLLFFKKDVLYKSNGITYTIDSKTQVITVNGTSDADNVTCYAYDALPKQLYNGVYSCTVEKLTDFSSPIIIRTYNKDFTNGVVLNLQDSLSATIRKPYVNDEIAFSLRVDKGATFNNAKFKVSFYKGDIKKEYTPHQSDKKRLLYYNEETQTWEKPILREWDSIEKHANGKYYYHQRSGTKVLNGSEGWTGNYSFENTGRWVCTIPNIKENSPLVCDKFINKVNHGDGVESIFVPNPNKLYLTLSNDKGDPNVWLQTNPVTVVYQLAQEKVYECTNIDLITYANETNFIIESGVLSPKTTLKVHSNISNVVSLLQKKVSLLESNMTKYMITQNRLMLASRYNADTVSFKVDVASFSDTFEYDNDLYELILNNILVGKDNYNREYIENLIRFYWMDFIISDEMYSTLFEIIKEQHNPKIEEEEETPLI